MAMGDVEVRIIDALGVEREPSPDPEPAWHPSFRYFRLAQVSDEVFDAYRNLYLALEAILSTETPRGRGERESDWLLRALTEAQAGGTNLAAYAPPGATDLVQAIRQELYSDVRTATFHAKVGAPSLLPLDPVDRRAVVESLGRLAGLYLDLAQRVLNTRRFAGAVMKGGFDLMVGSLVAEVKVQVTDDETRIDADSTSVNPGGGRVEAMATRPSPEHDEPFVRTVLAEVPVHKLDGLTHVARFVTVASDETPVTGGQLEARLTLGGFDRLEALMGIRGLNVRLPRTFYAS
jgi:hypothetical protein